MDIQDIWRKATGRIVIATSRGGNAGEAIAFKANGRRYTGRCTSRVVQGECLALQDNRGNWWLVNAQAIPDNNQNTRQLLYIRTRPNKLQEREPVPIGASLFFFSWANSQQYYYIIGAHQENPVIWYQESSEIGFPPSSGVPGASAIRGIDYGGDWEIACHFTDTPNKKMVAYAPMAYQSMEPPSATTNLNALLTTSIAIRGVILRESAEVGGSSPATPIFLPAGTEIAATNRLVYDNQVGLIDKTSSNVLDTQKSFLNQFENPTPSTIDYLAEYGNNWRQVGGGYKIGDILLQTRTYGTTIAGFTGTPFVKLDGSDYIRGGYEYHIDIPPEYHYRIPYYQINDAGTAMELVQVAPTVLEKNKYSYSLPLATGRLPLRNPIVNCELTPQSNPSEIKYEGESYYWVGSDRTYITEYYNLDTANNIEERQFRYYAQGKFKLNLHLLAEPVFWHGGFPLSLSNKTQGDTFAAPVTGGFNALKLSIDNGFNLVNRKVKCVAAENNPTSRESYVAFGNITSVVSIAGGYEINVTLTSNPILKPFVASGTTIFGGTGEGNHIVSYDGDFGSFLVNTLTDVSLNSSRVFSVNLPSGYLWGRGSVIAPFDPNDPDYLKNLVDNNQLQRDFYGSLGNFYTRSQHDNLLPAPTNLLNGFDYLRSSWSHLRGNKAYKFHILNKSTGAYDDYLDSDGTDPNLLRGQTGISLTHACYVESWTFQKNGKISLDSNVLELPVHGVRTDVGTGSDYNFSDILDIDLIFNR